MYVMHKNELKSSKQVQLIGSILLATLGLYTPSKWIKFEYFDHFGGLYDGQNC